jgi:hypothetical protein
MAKVIAEKSVEGVASPKQVEIKHTRVMKDAAGKDVTVVDWTDVRPVDDMITQAEAELATCEAKVIELKEDIAAYKVIKG